MATGVTHAYFGHDEWRSHAPGLKTLDDALQIRRKILLTFEQAEREPDEETRRRLLTFVIVGGGPTGVELAGALPEVAFHALKHDFRRINPGQTRIILVEGGPAVLPQLPASLRDSAAAALRGLGIEVRVTAIVTDVGDGLVCVGNERLAAGVTLWAAGVPASPQLRSLGVPLDRAGRVVVETDLTIPGHHEVYVIGDAAVFTDSSGGLLPGVAPVAMQQGEHAAANIVRTIRGEADNGFRYRNYGNLATIGRAAAVADFGRIRLSGVVAWLAWLFIHLVKLIGFRNRILVMMQWAWSYFTYQRSVRLITGDADQQAASGRIPSM